MIGYTVFVGGRNIREHREGRQRSQHNTADLIQLMFYAAGWKSLKSNDTVVLFPPRHANVDHLIRYF